MVKSLPAVQRLGFDPCVGKIPWRRKWQPTAVFLPGESHGWRSLAGYSPWGRKESDMTERLHSLTHSELWELTQDWGNKFVENTNKTLCAPGPRRKEQWPHKRLTQTSPWGSRSLWWRQRLALACCRAGGTECRSACMGPFEGDHLTYTIVWLQVT